MSGLEIILPLVFAGISAAASAGDLASRLKPDKTASSKPQQKSKSVLPIKTTASSQTSRSHTQSATWTNGPAIAFADAGFAFSQSGHGGSSMAVSSSSHSSSSNSKSVGR